MDSPGLGLAFYQAIGFIDDKIIGPGNRLVDDEHFSG